MMRALGGLRLFRSNVRLLATEAAVMEKDALRHPSMIRNAAIIAHVDVSLSCSQI